VCGTRNNRCARGNRTLKRILTQCAWPAVRNKRSQFYRLFQRWRVVLGARKAIIAVAHRLLIVIWKLLHEGETYTGCRLPADAGNHTPSHVEVRKGAGGSRFPCHGNPKHPDNRRPGAGFRECELNGANPFDCLTELLRHAEELKQSPSEWMPWNYRDTLARLATPAVA
jgi:hypothetical protein